MDNQNYTKSLFGAAPARLRQRSRTKRCWEEEPLKGLDG
jgi:hypothetical protein